MKSIAVMTLLLNLVLNLLFSTEVLARFSPSKVIGQNDLVAVDANVTNIPLKYKDLVNAFGLMSMGCTATHIGYGYVLTAGHCFSAPQELVKNVSCEDVTIKWGVREGVEPYLESKCERVVFAQQNDSGSDFAIVEVSPAPEAAIEIELVRTASVGDVITIFSHPEELPLRWSKTCQVESESDPEISDSFLRHKCDTKPGSSGATIIDANTNKVVAIHDGGHLTFPGVGLNYGTLLTSPNLHDSLKAIGF